MKKTIKRIVDRIRFSYPIMIEESLTKILEEELPDFQRIDEERIIKIYENKGYFLPTIKEYNSTLPPALVPLPKEMPSDDYAGVIAAIVASNVRPKLTTQEEAFFIAGFTECVKYLRTSPLLASKDARIRELEEELEREKNSVRIITKDAVDKLINQNNNP